MESLPSSSTDTCQVNKTTLIATLRLSEIAIATIILALAVRYWPSPRTITNPMAFLVQSADNGNRHDWPLPRGYVISDSVQLSDRSARQTWDFEPFRSFEANRGDGFQVAEIGDDGFVRFTSTLDGGTSWIQHFVGSACGGTGWIVFGDNATTGSWREVIARLNIAQDPRACPTVLNPAYTRYRLENVRFPFAVDNIQTYRDISTVVSEHYNRRSISEATALERSYLGAGYGLLRWEAWGRSPPSIRDLPERCSTVDFSQPPAPGWEMHDCRTYTNIRTKD